MDVATNTEEHKLSPGVYWSGGMTNGLAARVAYASSGCYVSYANICRALTLPKGHEIADRAFKSLVEGLDDVVVVITDLTIDMKYVEKALGYRPESLN